ncbi:MAG: RsmB/NOP family class I SAM-dependent RNA methyltransferase [Gemmatimonadetes bacterium]|nr:RsmB/NOP family class I SAM-dependent RNA methyltransferase [Gemmatimonadota bacterium]NNK62228.1 RsmB/NOP family class I SAM-dependent RNA methyltransferase [Gemmatimonadota bacterium]
MHGLEAYRDIIDDWDAFERSLTRPEPTTLRVNRLRTDVPTVRAALESEGFVLEAVEGQPWFLRVVDAPRKVSDTFGHWAGWFYIQQASTGVAAGLLGARPGERILDLCAAPGGKTLHIAESLEGRGCVVAGEVNEGRIRALLGNVYRLGTPNVLVVSGDGRQFPAGATFDRVMVDVPCSALGTVRKKGGRLPTRSRAFMKKITRAQERLLRRAIDLTRPGGVVLYVTCTFGPEENEAVVSRVLADAPVDLEPMTPPVPHARGVTEFAGESFDPRLEGAVRIYPHHLDSGGLFLCRLRKHGPDEAVRGWTPVPAVFPGDPTEPDPELSVRATLDLLASHYGVAAAAGVDEGTAGGAATADPAEPTPLGRWMRRGSNLWLHGLDAWPVDHWEPGRHWRVVALGLRAVDLSGDGPPRPTNDLLQRLDDQVTRNRVDLTAEEWRGLLDGRRTDIPGIERGHVALGLETPSGRHVVGWGFVRDGRLKDHIPRGRRKWLRNVVAD